MGIIDIPQNYMQSAVYIFGNQDEELRNNFDNISINTGKSAQ